MYPSGENYTEIASAAFRDALLDANMLQPTSVGTAALFNALLCDIILGGDDNLFGSTRVVNLETFKPTITIGFAYGTEIGYAGDTYKDLDIFVPFTTWQKTGDTRDEIDRRLSFARDHRQNVFSAHGLDFLFGGVVGARPRATSPVTGLVAVDYRWRFHYSRS